MRITPHPSHVMGRVAGERRCTSCWSAPAWDIIEEPCPTEGSVGVVRRSEREYDVLPPWPDDLIAESYRAYAAGDRIEDIAARAGRTVDATTNRIANYRARHGLPPRPRRPQPERVTRARMAELATMPGTLRAVAAATGASQATVSRAREVARMVNGKGTAA